MLKQPVDPDSQRARQGRMDECLNLIQKKDWSLFQFLEELFLPCEPGDPRNSQARVQMLQSFLSGHGKNPSQVAQIADLIYNHRYSKPIPARSSENRTAAEAPHRDRHLMARSILEEWALRKIEDILSREAADFASSKDMHLTNEVSNWDTVLNFAMGDFLRHLQAKCPFLLRILITVAYKRKNRPSPDPDSSPSHPTYNDHFARPVPSGSGNNPHNPFMMILAASLVLLTAPVLSFLQVLSHSALSTLRQKAAHRGFLLIYNNINRMSRAWNPELGKKDNIHNGTAATFIELEDCNVDKAFNIEALETAKREECRRQLTLDKLQGQIKWDKLEAVMVLHCLNMLIEEVPCLSDHCAAILNLFRTTHAMHRMAEGRKTKIFPMATSDYNEGNTGENANILDDLLLRQLGLPKEEVARLLVIVGGNQSTVEKLRTLKKFLADCQHGYHDLSSFLAMNNVFGRKVTNSKRPDYYPAQYLVFDTLLAAVVDCWKVHIGVTDLQAYFTNHPTSFEDLLSMASDITRIYMMMERVVRAHYGSNAMAETVFKTFDEAESTTPSQESTQPTPDNTTTNTNATPAAQEPAPFLGDQALANSVLRIRDSMWHFVFQWAVSDGDIGQAINVMAVRTFTFMGSGKTKYTNELLELACNFLFEYSPELVIAIMHNWLCNLTGNAGCYFPMDLLQEKNIKRLKQMAQRWDALFGGDFFKNVIALNIHACIQSIHSMKAAVKLGVKSESHTTKKRVAALRDAGKKMALAQIHKFRQGRMVGWWAQDDWAIGYQKFRSGTRIQDFIERTIRDAGDLHGPDAPEVEADTHAEDEGQTAGVLPNMIIGGVLVTADDIEDLEDERRDEENQFNIFGMDTALDDGSSSDEEVVTMSRGREGDMYE
ncbi:hypothetical protein OF83DRAFT_1083068 [Amylostereum chailletii]|nr:hypothetical protein OF83DRAFT_1083068 [Amylostereum chailletii]